MKSANMRATVVAAVFLLAGCGSAIDPAPSSTKVDVRAAEPTPSAATDVALEHPIPRHILGETVKLSLDSVRAFPLYPVFAASDSPLGLELGDVWFFQSPPEPGAEQRGAKTWHNAVAITYGTCDFGEDGGCAKPVQVHSWPACDRYLSLWDTGEEPGSVSGSLKRFALGDALGVIVDAGQVAVFSGDSTIDVWAPTTDDAIRIARSLQPLNGLARAMVSEDGLPAPAPGALEGKSECSHDPSAANAFVS